MAAADAGCKVFVGGLSWETTSEALKAYFEQFGEVTDAPIMRDRATSKPRGFGFVVFRDAAVADRVVSQPHTIDGRQVDAKRATPREAHAARGPEAGYGNGGGGGYHNNGSASPGPAPRSKKIFVGGLSPTMPEDAFRRYFEQYGPISDSVVMYDPATHRPRGFGFVTFESEEAVDAVMATGAMHNLDGKTVEVKVAVPKDQIEPRRMLGPSPGAGSLPTPGLRTPLGGDRGGPYATAANLYARGLASGAPGGAYANPVPGPYGGYGLAAGAGGSLAAPVGYGSTYGPPLGGGAATGFGLREPYPSPYGMYTGMVAQYASGGGGGGGYSYPYGYGGVGGYGRGGDATGGYAAPGAGYDAGERQSWGGGGGYYGGGQMDAPGNGGGDRYPSSGREPQRYS